MPYFLYNTVGGITAICGVDEYREAKRRGRRWTIDGKFLVVPSVVVFGNASEKFRHLVATVFVYHEREKLEKTLFVPFASERYFAANEQEALFFGGNFAARLSGVPPSLAYSRAQQWVANKIAGIDANDWRRRFAQKWLAGSTLRLLICVAMAGFLALGVAYYESARSARERTNTTYYFTEMERGKLAPVMGVPEELEKLPMRETDVTDRSLRAGRAKRVMSVGGGLDFVCISVEGRELCGFSARVLNVQQGDDVVFRGGRPIVTPAFNYAQWLWWVISKEEAEALKRVGFEVVR
ncbi:MAG: hypothetical protein AAB463_01005 [Patescibacteria group bacterium]